MNLNLKHPYIGPAVAVILLGVVGLWAKRIIDEDNAKPQKFNWTLVTAWSDDLPILTSSVKQMATEIQTQSYGRLKIDVRSAGKFNTGGIPVPVDGLFEAVRRNEAQMLHSAAYYHQTIIGSAFFSAVPFGMNYNEMNSWINGPALKLWRDLYQPYNMIPFPCGHTHEQMGGWFNFVADNSYQFDRKKIRMPGLGGKVLEKLGAQQKTYAQNQIYEGLKLGHLDAAEWIGPYHDYCLKLHEVARKGYYYKPGWQEYNTMFELVINQTAWNSLPQELKHLVKDKITLCDSKIAREFGSKNSEYTGKMKNEGVKFRKFSDELLGKLYGHSQIVIDDYVKGDTSKSKIALKIKKSYYEFPEFKIRFDTLGEGFKQRAQQISLPVAH